MDKLNGILFFKPHFKEIPFWHSPHENCSLWLDVPRDMSNSPLPENMFRTEPALGDAVVKAGMLPLSKTCRKVLCIILLNENLDLRIENICMWFASYITLPQRPCIVFPQYPVLSPPQSKNPSWLCPYIVSGRPEY